MPPFSIHWSPVPHPAADSRLFALWPAPVNDDACFRAAGFTEFGDADDAWDREAELLLGRVIDELRTRGEPCLRSEPLVKPLPWYRRLLSRPPPLPLREQIEWPMHWDNLPDCIVDFGASGARLRTGQGHEIYWITLPAADAPSFEPAARRLAAGHPLVRTDLRWSCLLPPDTGANPPRPRI